MRHYLNRTAEENLCIITYTNCRRFCWANIMLGITMACSSKYRLQSCTGNHNSFAIPLLSEQAKCAIFKPHLACVILTLIGIIQQSRLLTGCQNCQNYTTSYKENWVHSFHHIVKMLMQTAYFNQKKQRLDC